MRRDTIFRTMLFCGAALAAQGYCGLARAADNAADSAASSAPAVVSEITVTAQKRVERLQDVPLSVAVVSPKAVETQGIRNLQDLGQAVVGVQINFSGFSTQPSIRGVSTLTTGVGFENNVAVYIDGFYQADTSGINSDFANLAGIQVLKGPQGTLYGRDATGGAILITTLAPSKTFTMKAEATYGSFNERSLSAYLSGPITDRIRFSLAAYGRQDDGYIKELSPTGVPIGNAAPTASYYLQAKLQADVTNDITSTTAYTFDEISDGRGLVFNYQNYRPSYFPAPQGQLYQNNTLATNVLPVQLNQITSVTETLAWKTPIGTLTSYSGFRYEPIDQDFEYDGSYLNLVEERVKYDETSVEQALDYDINVIKNLDLALGANFFANTNATPLIRVYESNALVEESFGTSRERAYAAYFDGAYHLTSRLVLDVGGRYTQESSDSHSYAKSGSYIISSVSAALAHASYSNFSPRASLRYELDPRSDVYFSYSQGFRAGLFQTVATPQGTLSLPIQPEHITAYEVGYKTAQSKVQFTTAGYYYDYTDIQVGLTIPNPLFPSAPINIVSNAPEAIIYGAEAQVAWEPVDRLNINLGGAWTHARYTNFPNATGNGLDFATLSNITAQTQSWNGQQMARAPNFTATGSVDYTFVHVLGGNLLASVNVKYTTSYVPNNPSLYGPLGPPGLQSQERYVQGGYALVNGSLTWSSPESRYKLGVWVNNLTNQFYHLSYNGGAFGDYGTSAPPRAFGVRIGYSF